MKKITLISLLFFAAFMVCSGAFAEDITLTTYYPAPFGVYRTLTVSNNNNNIILGSDNTTPGIELRDADALINRPYIDFSDETPVGEDFDMRIWRTGPDSLEVIGGVAGVPTLSITNNNGTPGITRTGRTWYCATY